MFIYLNAKQYCLLGNLLARLTSSSTPTTDEVPMMPLVEQLAAAATLHGARGVRTFLQEHRQLHSDLLEQLAATTIMGDAVGLRIQSLPLHVQRELWSAFVKWRSLLPSDALRALAWRLVERAEASHEPLDPTCLWLAGLVRDTQEEDDGESMDGRVTASTEDSTDPLDDQLHQLVFLPDMDVMPTSQPRKRRRSVEQESSPRVETPAPDVADAAIETKPSQSSRPSPVALPAEVETRVAVLAKQLVLLGAPDASADDSSKGSELATVAVELLRQVMNQVHATQQDNETLFHAACRKLQIAQTSDDALFQITSGLMDANWSSRYAAIYLETAMLPRILHANSVISRVLVQTVLLYAKPHYTTALVTGLLVPLLTTPSIGPSQGEAVTRMLREKCVPSDQLDAFLRLVLESSHSSGNHGLLANEATVLVFQNVLNMKPTLAPSTLELLVTAARSALDHEATRATLPKSAKFATLLFTLVSKFGPQCKAHVEELEAVASQLSSTMAKSTMRAIQKLKN